MTLISKNRAKVRKINQSQSQNCGKMQKLLTEGVQFRKTDMCKNSKIKYEKNKERRTFLIKKHPISSVFLQIMCIFAPENNQVIAKNCKITALYYK